MDSVKKSTTTRSQSSPAAAGANFMPGKGVVNNARLQMASKVSVPHDPEEREADNTAQKVMRMAIPAASVAYVRQGGGGTFRRMANGDDKLTAKLRSPYIARFGTAQPAPEQEKMARQAASEEPEAIKKKAQEEEPKVQAKAMHEEEPKVQAKAINEEEPRVQAKAMNDEEPRVQAKAMHEEEHKVQAKPMQEEEHKVQAKPINEEEPMVQRQPEQEEEETLQRKAVTEEQEPVQRKAEGNPDVASNVSANIRSSMSSGQPLPLSVRQFMEPRFNADFSNVRVHTDDNAAGLNRQVNAKAFAVNNHVFFGKGQYQPDSDQGKELIAHELTHTIQQGGAVQRAAEEEPPPVQRVAAAEPSQAPSLQRSPVAVTGRSGPKVQRLGISDALDYFADRAYLIPGFRMLTIILGMNPINQSRVERSAANILRAIIEFLPGGNLITRALDNHGIFERAGAWVERQISALGLTFSTIRQALDRFLDSLSWSDIFDLGGVWNRAKRIFSEPINRIKALASSLYNGIIEMIKEVILRPLAQLASRTPFWNLLTAVLGANPITGEPVARTADTIIGGFMTMIGQQDVWQNIKRANAVGRAWAWFQGAMAGLIGFVRSIPTLFLSVFRSLGIRDLLDIPGAFARVARVFGSFAGRFFSWAGGTVMQLLQIIFEVVAPGVMPYIRRAAGAFTSIIRNPIGFLGNLVRAGKLGFMKFKNNFVTHLKTSLINWLTGTLAGTGVHIPEAFTLKEILKFVLSVLGLTWQNIRQKLVRVVGETAVGAMESGFALVRTLVTEGPAAAWQQLLEGLSNLKDMVIEQIITFVRNRIVVQAITKLASMLSPVGAFVQAIISIYNTVMFFVERLRTIAQVAMSFINSIAAIAAGRLAAAAGRVESTMAGMLTLVISFLARFAGLGRVSDAVKNLINRVRAPINRGIDRVVAWIVTQARRLGRFVAQAGVPNDPNQRLRLAGQAAIAAARRLSGNRVTAALLQPLLAAIRARYGLTTIEPFERGGNWWVRITINPATETNLGVGSGSGGDSAEQAQARAAFGSRLFSRQELQGNLNVSGSTANRRINEWKSAGALHTLASAPSDPLTLYSFDASKAGQRETNPNNRAKYGYSNPAKTSPVGLQVLTLGLLRNRSPQPIRATSAAYHQTKAWYRSVVTTTIFQFGRAILGHRPPGASGHWNRIGHTQPRSTNQAWNRSLAAYHGPEEMNESSATGGASERYRVPSKEAGSHSSWW
ncbi:DUF4157 domain-containing protein [Halioxenophilus sp. WMMB6]|uniref:eCIS core domain-containing protein n=1 Tax=Halioxenophilus sp. WMMB6 TaxID=3073815 RepID=UPI00295E79F2|nr:DUF4157 domain-containing protein [Halioxenophilus sp. WMMB6]